MHGLRRRLNLAFVVYTSIPLAGCVTAPDIAHPDLDVATPDRWGASQSSTGEASNSGEHTPIQPSSGVGAIDETPTQIPFDWWREFQDPEIEALVYEALRKNRNLQATAARVLSAAAQARIAGADALPQIGLNFNGSRDRRNFIGLPVPGGDGVLTTRSTTLGLSLDVSWELDVWGRLRSQTGAAIADTEAIEADYHAAQLSLVGQTVKTWFSIREGVKQVALAEETLDSFRASAEQVQDRYERGLRPPLDLRLARTNVATAQAVLEQRREAVDSLNRQFEVLLGRYPKGEVQRGEGDVLASDLPRLAPQLPAGIPSELVFRRPDLAAAERRLAAAGARVEAARAGLYPRFSLTASGGTQSDEFADLFDSDFSVWRLAGNILQPIFQGGRLLAGVDVAIASQREALSRYVHASLEAFAEVESAMAAEIFLSRREAALAAAAEQAVAASELAQQRYTSGLDDFITVREAQRSAFESQSQLLAVRRLRLTRRVDLYLALGGGFVRATAPQADTGVQR